MALSLPSTYLLSFVDRMAELLPDASAQALEGSGLDVGDRVFKAYNPAAPDRSWQIIHNSLSKVRERAGHHQYLTTHLFTLRFIASAVDGGFWMAYPILYYTFAPSIVAYFDARLALIGQDGQGGIPYYAAEQSGITGAQFFGSTPNGETPVSGIDFDFTAVFRIANASSGNNP